MQHFLGSDAVDAALLTAGAAVVAAFIGAAISWVRDLSFTARRARVLDESAKRIQFWREWVEGLEAIAYTSAIDRMNAESEMRRTAETVKAYFGDPEQMWEWSASEFKAYRARPSWKRWLLLYKQPSPSARRMRWMLYAMPIAGFFEVLMLHSRWGSYIRPAGLHRPFSFERFTVLLFALLLCLVFLRTRVIRAEDSYVKHHLWEVPSANRYRS